MDVHRDDDVQEVAYKEKRSGDARDSWYIREGFEALLEEGIDKFDPSGDTLPNDAAAQPKEHVRDQTKDLAEELGNDHGEDRNKVRASARAAPVLCLLLSRVNGEH